MSGTVPQGAAETTCSECSYTYGTHAPNCSKVASIHRKPDLSPEMNAALDDLEEARASFLDPTSARNRQLVRDLRQVFSDRLTAAQTTLDQEVWNAAEAQRRVHDARAARDFIVAELHEFDQRHKDSLP